MNPIISPLSEDDLNQLAKQLNFAELCLSVIIENATFENSMNDLDLIQQGLDSGEITDTIDLQSLGVPFGQLFINANAGFGWWIVEDNFGRAPCIRYKETDLLLHPLTLISKRIEDDEQVNVRELFNNLSGQLAHITQQLDPNQA